MADESKNNDTPAGKSKLVDRLNAYRNLILAVAALATAVGSWFRPTDTTATKNSYEWTAKKIEELAANDIKTKEDIVGLRNYLEGYLKGQTQGFPTPPGTVAVPVSNAEVGGTTTSGQGAGYGSGAGRLGGRKPKPKAVPKPPETTIVPFEQAVPVPPPLPELKANPTAIKRPEFENVANAEPKD